MDTGLEHFRHAGPRRTCTHGNASSDALCHGDDVGHYIELLERERRAATIHTALHFVEHEHGAVFLGQTTSRFQVLSSARVHAAFALNGFD